MLRELLDKLLYNGLDDAREKGTRRIVARFSRGNVAVQNGRFMTQEEFDVLRERGDRAWDRVRLRVAPHKK